MKFRGRMGSYIHLDYEKKIRHSEGTKYIYSNSNHRKLQTYEGIPKSFRTESITK
jgi:hypothetical protein